MHWVRLATSTVHVLLSIMAAPPQEASARRLEALVLKRQASLALITDTFEYQACRRKQSSVSEAARSLHDVPHVPRMPNPADGTLSKRQWEHQICIWRNGWKRFLDMPPQHGLRRTRFEESLVCRCVAEPSQAIGVRLQTSAEAYVFKYGHERDECLGMPFEAQPDCAEPLSLKLPGMS